MAWFVLVVFAAVYIGMAAGRLPWLRVDRAWIAAAGAAALIGAGFFKVEQAASAIDAGAIVVLFALMILSAQFSISGFYERCAAWIVHFGDRPALLLGATVALGGGLSALLVNDIVAFALTPVLCAGARARGLDARPFLLGLAGAANAGSAATLIGNPQNILIGQAGKLDFWSFGAVCGPPALAALLIVYLVIWLWWRRRWHTSDAQSAVATPPDTVQTQALDRAALRKALVASIALLALFATPLPREAAALLVAMVLMASRRHASRALVERVDWNLLLLFAGLFIVTEAFARAGWSDLLAQALQQAGFNTQQAAPLALASLAGSNLIGNVPFVMLLLELEPRMSAGALYALALFSTLAGNLLLVGSVVNLIVVERARACGIKVGFFDFAKAGLPITLASMALAVAWLVNGGWLRW